MKKTSKAKRQTLRKKKENAPVDEIDPLFAPIVNAFASDKQVVRKRMFSSSNVLTVKGKIFAMLTRGNLVVKLPKERVDELVKNGVGKRFDPGHGRKMKGWLSIAPGKGPWLELSNEGYRFVSEGKGLE